MIAPMHGATVAIIGQDTATTDAVIRIISSDSSLTISTQTETEGSTDMYTTLWNYVIKLSPTRLPWCHQPHLPYIKFRPNLYKSLRVAPRAIRRTALSISGYLPRRIRKIKRSKL